MFSRVTGGYQRLPHTKAALATCSKLTTADHSRPALLCRVQGWPAGTFALSRQHMLWWHQVTLMVAATAGFLAILEQREIGGGLAAQGRFLSGACR